MAIRPDSIDYQRVVEYLRDVRVSSVLMLTDTVRQYAEEYATLCVHANDRLRRCSTLLQEGLRSEAVHLAEESPNLLELVAALDLPAPEAWAEFCQQSELPVPPPLQMDRAAQLNDAYEQEQPLKTLLARHRRLALGRAPIRHRLAVLREIHQLDPGAAHLESDVRHFERARYTELSQAFSQALTRHDSKTLSAIATEMDTVTWIEPPPEDLRRGVTDSSLRLQRTNAAMELRNLMAPLQSAFASRTLEDCRALLKRYKEVLEQCGLARIPGDMAPQIQPIVEWLRREDQDRARQSDIDSRRQALAAAIAGDVADAPLAAAYDHLRQLEQAPPDLERDYQALISARASARRQARRVKLIVGAALFLVIAGIGTFAGLQYMRSTEVATWTGKLRAANALGDVDMARQFISEQEKRSPELNGYEALTSAKQETKRLEEKRAAEMQAQAAMVESLEQTLTTATASAESPEATAEQLLNACALIDASLKQAADSTRNQSAEQSAQVRSRIQRLESTRASLAQRATASLLKSTEALAARVTAAPTGPDVASMDAGLATLAEVENTIKPLRRFATDDSTKAALDALTATVESRKAALADSREQTAELIKLRQKATSATSLATALTAFADKFPQSALSADFNRATKSMAPALALEAWRDLSSDWTASPYPASSAAAITRAEAISAYLISHPTSPLVAQISPYHEYLKQAGEALAEKGAWQSAMNDALTNPLVAEASYFDVSDGRRFWILGDPKRTDRRLGERGTSTFESIDPRNLPKPKVVTIASPLTLQSDKPIHAPHAAVASLMAAQVRLIDEKNWDSWGPEQAERLAKNKEMDVVVKSILVQQVLKTTRQVAGWGVGDAYDKILRDLARHDVDNIVWYDPDRPVSDSVKASLKTVMDAMPDAASVKARITARRAELARVLSVPFIATGVLLRDEKGAWAVYTNASCSDGDIACAIRVSSATEAGAAVLMPIARYSTNHFTPDEKAIGELPQGTMVFIRHP